MRALVGAEPGVIPATYAKKKGERKRIIGEDDRPGRFGDRGGRRPFGRGMRRGMRGRGEGREEGDAPEQITEAPPAAETTADETS